MTGECEKTGNGLEGSLFDTLKKDPYETIEAVVKTTQKFAYTPPLIEIEETEGMKYISPVGWDVVLVPNTRIRAYGYRNGASLSTFYIQILDDKRNFVAEVPAHLRP